MQQQVTVGEVVAALRAMPQDMVVALFDMEYGEYNPLRRTPAIVEVGTNRDGSYKQIPLQWYSEEYADSVGMAEEERIGWRAEVAKERHNLVVKRVVSITGR